MRFHRRMRHLVRHKTPLRDVVRFDESLLRIAKHMVVVLFQVMRFAIVDQVGFRVHRFFRIEVRRQNFILDINQAECAIRCPFVNRGDARNVVAYVTYLVDREGGFVVTDRMLAMFKQRPVRKKE